MRLPIPFATTSLLVSILPTSAAARQIAGMVVNRDTGAGIPSALVQLVGPDSTVQATTFTDERGAFALQARATREHRLFVSRLDYGSVHVALRDLMGGLSSLRVALDVRPVEIGGVEATATAARRSAGPTHTSSPRPNATTCRQQPL